MSFLMAPLPPHNIRIITYQGPACMGFMDQMAACMDLPRRSLKGVKAF